MKKLGIFILIIVGCIGYYKYSYPDYTYRYKMTIEVDTPEGVKSGSSVIEVHTTQWPKWLKHASGGNNSFATAKGEAIFIKLNDTKNIVVLLANGSTAKSRSIITKMAPQAFLGVTNKEVTSIDRIKWAKQMSIMTGDKVNLRNELFPTIISFKNTNNSNSSKLVYAVDLKKIHNKQGKNELLNKVTFDNFNNLFGQGYKLKNIWIELTKENLGKNIKKHLPWLKNNNLGAIHVESPAGIIKLYRQYHFIIDKNSF